MAKQWGDFQDGQKKIISGLAKTTRSSAPFIIDWLNKVNEIEGDVWPAIEKLGGFLDKYWKR